MQFSTSLNSILEIIYPPRCIICGEPGDLSAGTVCSNCIKNITILATSVNVVVDRYYDNLWALAAYDGSMPALIQKLKYQKSRAVMRFLSEFLGRYTPPTDGCDCIVPVPLNRWRYIGRGYNQSVIIARILSKSTGIPVFKRALAKVKGTPAQVGLELDERKVNVKGSFAPPRYLAECIEEKRVLLVDDVVTTGATVSECSKALKGAGAHRVDVLTLAKTV